jgi:hypothetical protein
MGDTEALILSLPEHRVDVVEASEPARRHWSRCEIGRDLTFDTAGLEAYCLANWDETVFDAFVVAAAVQFCDQTKARPATGWGRDLALRIPVHNPNRWSAPAVSTALYEALSFLTGDRWQITFKARKERAARPQQGRFSMPDASRVIIPFSDGLDSRAVAALMEMEFGHRLIRVRLGLKSWKPGEGQSQRRPFASVPYSVSYGKTRSVETSARSRGFKFALLSGIAAYLSEASEIIVPESGQGALGPYWFQSVKHMKTTGIIRFSPTACGRSYRRCLATRSATLIRASGTPKAKRLLLMQQTLRTAITGGTPVPAGRGSGRFL